MPKHPSGPHTPSPLPSPRAPKPWGTWSPQTAKEALPSGIPVAPATSPLCFLRGACQGDHWPFNTRFGGKSGGAKTEQKHRIRETRHPPRDLAGWERLPCSLCNCIAERLPRSCLCVSPRQLQGGGTGAGWTGALVLYQRCYISVKGWGGEGVTGAMEVETPPPSGQQMFLFVQSLFLFFVFFFLVDGDSCEFSKGAI